jgi:hypothetical protein
MGYSTDYRLTFVANKGTQFCSTHTQNIRYSRKQTDITTELKGHYKTLTNRKNYSVKKNRNAFLHLSQE